MSCAAGAAPCGTPTVLFGLRSVGVNPLCAAQPVPRDGPLDDLRHVVRSLRVCYAIPYSCLVRNPPLSAVAACAWCLALIISKRSTAAKATGLSDAIRVAVEIGVVFGLR